MKRFASISGKNVQFVENKFDDSLNLAPPCKCIKGHHYVSTLLLLSQIYMNAHMNSFFVPEYVYNAGKHKMNLAGHEFLRDAVSCQSARCILKSCSSEIKGLASHMIFD